MPNNISKIVNEVKDKLASVLGVKDDEVQSYANQIDQCRKMKQNLNDLQMELGQTLNQFTASVMALKAEEYVSEELKNVARVAATYPDMALALSHHLDLRHVGYIDDQEKQVTATANAALGGGS